MGDQLLGIPRLFQRRMLVSLLTGFIMMMRRIFIVMVAVVVAELLGFGE